MDDGVSGPAPAPRSACEPPSVGAHPISSPVEGQGSKAPRPEGWYRGHQIDGFRKRAILSPGVGGAIRLGRVDKTPRPVSMDQAGRRVLRYGPG
jgi:hypothetical protein